MKNTFLIYFVLLVSTTVFSQEDKIIIIDKGEAEHKEKKEHSIVENTEAVKFSPLQMIIGDVSLGYETRIGEKTSLEFEAGPNFSRVQLFIDDNHFNDPNGSGSELRSALGFFVSTGLRFYPMDYTKALNGFYISPIIRYRMKNYLTHDFSENLDDISARDNQLHFIFNFGYQLWLSESFSLDFYGGMGLGHESRMRYNLTSVYDDLTNTYSYNWDKNAYSGTRFLLNLGVKIGLGW